MKVETLSLLCSPTTGEPLEMFDETDEAGRPRQVLVSELSGERFAIRDGIPVFYDQSRLSGFDLEYQGFYKKVARYYDPALKALGFLAGAGEVAFRKEYLRELEIQEGDYVLEVSIGTGANLRLMPEKVEYFGLDLSWSMLAKCRQNMAKWNRQAELIYGNAEGLPFKDNIFDVVFHVGGINAFNDRAKAICEMLRVARPGSKIVIVDETDHMMKRMQFLPSVRKMIREWGDRFLPPAHLVPPEVREVESKLIAKKLFYCLTFRKP